MADDGLNRGANLRRADGVQLSRAAVAAPLLLSKVGPAALSGGSCRSRPLQSVTTR